ncbi:MAG: hypothetical protein ABI647_01605 [Gemmatimonadota bacterium]
MTDPDLNSPLGDQPHTLRPSSPEWKWAGGDPRWAVGLMRDQTRRSWLVPLLAVPIAQVVTASDMPRAFLPLEDEEVVEASDLGRAVLAAAERIQGSPGSELTPREALSVVGLAMLYHGLVGQLFLMRGVAAAMLRLPAGLAGEGLVRQLAGAIGERPETPARLAVLAEPLLSHLAREDRGRSFLPVPHAFFTPIARAFDRRCYELGFCNWADALRHAASVWTAEAWRGLLMAYAAGSIPALIQTFDEHDAGARPAPVVQALPPTGKPKGEKRWKRSDERELNQLRERLAAAETKAESARAAATAAQLREAELVHARDRAQARVIELSARVESFERDLKDVRGRLAVHEATIRRLTDPGTPEPTVPEPIAPPPLPTNLLHGRAVFFFTGVARGSVARAQAESLRALGAVDIRLYDMGQGRPGPNVFPPGSVVIVDVRFVGHSQTEEIEARVRRSDVTYLVLQAGEGGLAARVAERLAGGRG